MPIDQNKEKEFDEWLESITFVNEEGELIPAELTDDDSPDPEYDRGE